MKHYGVFPPGWPQGWTARAGAEAIASDGAGWPLITRHKVGAGSVVLTLVPHMLGLDERAHPALPWLMNGLTRLGWCRHSDSFCIVNPYEVQQIKVQDDSTALV